MTNDKETIEVLIYRTVSTINKLKADMENIKKEIRDQEIFLDLFKYMKEKLN